jgi:hypothetical protein
MVSGTQCDIRHWDRWWVAGAVDFMACVTDCFLRIRRTLEWHHSPTYVIVKSNIISGKTIFWFMDLSENFEFISSLT